MKKMERCSPTKTLWYDACIIAAHTLTYKGGKNERDAV